MWVVNTFNGTTTGFDPWTYRSYFLYNNTGATGWAPSSGYTYSGINLTNQNSMEIPCGASGATIISIFYYAFGASGQLTGTYIVPGLQLHKQCSPCIAI
jgi:hypothetical protein